MFRITREETNGVRWLEANKGEFDFTYDPNKGWVSICHDYIMNRPDLGIPLRTSKGVRWKLTQEELNLIPNDDKEWVHDCPDASPPEPTGLANNELADFVALFPKVDFGYDVDEQLVIYTGRYLGTREVNDANAD